MVECKEPGCKQPATQSWNGRMLCDDHYDLYRDQLDRMRKDME